VHINGLRKSRLATAPPALPRSSSLTTRKTTWAGRRACGPRPRGSPALPSG